jgi:outer membrane protein assembly factor BamB
VRVGVAVFVCAAWCVTVFLVAGWYVWRHPGDVLGGFPPADVVVVFCPGVVALLTSVFLAKALSGTRRFGSAVVVGSLAAAPALVVAGLFAAWLAYARFPTLLVPLGFTLTGVLAVFLLSRWPRRRRYPRVVVRALLTVVVMLSAATGWVVVSEYRLGRGPTTVAAVAATTAEPIWTVGLAGAGGVSTPTIRAGVVVVQTGQSDQSPVGSLVRVDFPSGRPLWQVATDGGNCGGAAAGADPPVVVDTVAVIRSPTGDVRGIDVRDGGERWRATVAAAAPAAATNGVVLVAGQRTFTGLDAATGRQRWTRTIADAAWADWRPAQRPFVLGAASVFLLEVTGAGGFGVAAVDASSGRELWRDAIAFLEYSYQHFVVDGVDTVAAFQSEADGDGQPLRLVGRDLRSGKVLWTTPQLPLNRDDMPQTEVAAHAGTVFHASTNGQLVALAARTGNPRWTASFPARPGTLYLAADENVVVVQQGDRLFGFDPATGARRWSKRLHFKPEPESVAAVGGGLVIVPQSTACVLPVGGG